jgi:hypothetical protein
MEWPYRLILRGIQIEDQREAARQLIALRLAAFSDGMEQGREYVPDPKDEKPSSKAHYSLARFQKIEDQLEARAAPWAAAERQRQQALAVTEAKWSAFGRLVGKGVSA